MTIDFETTALQKLSTVDWDADGAYVYTRSFTPIHARQLEQELGDYMRKEPKLQIREDGRKVK